MASLLITGGTGTFGKACIEYLLNTQAGSKLIRENDIKRIIIFSRDEYKQHVLKTKFEKLYDKKNVSLLRFFIGDVREYDRLKIAFDNVDFVIHAAAMKQVPACEINPSECIKTNVLGTMNVVNAAIDCKVKKVVLLSTDKAVEPINIYGACKMTGEKYGVFANSYAHGQTKICCVRYGNVVASRGSIIETFINQSLSSDYFTITDEKMTRFFMLPEEACKLSFYALFSWLAGGEIFVPLMKSFKIVELIRLLNDSKEIVNTGIRPGEKINEILINQSEERRVYECKSTGYYVVLPENNVWNPELTKYIYSESSNYKKLEEDELVKFKSDTAMRYTNSEILALIDKERTHVEI